MRRVVAVFVVGGVLANERFARADEFAGDTANGFRECRDLVDRNQREQQTWTSALPKKSATVPDDGLVVGAPWKTFFRGVGEALPVILPTLVPHLGATVRSSSPAIVLAWPWSIPLGPSNACTRRSGTFSVSEHRLNRIMIEPNLVVQDHGVGFSTRLGDRIVWHPTDWVVGVGGGMGTTLELSGFGEPLRASLSPEAVFHVGHCCEPGYVTLALRADFFFAGTKAAVPTATLGYTFF